MIVLLSSVMVAFFSNKMDVFSKKGHCLSPIWSCQGPKILRLDTNLHNFKLLIISKDKYVKLFYINHDGISMQWFTIFFFNPFTITSFLTSTDHLITITSYCQLILNHHHNLAKVIYHFTYHQNVLSFDVQWHSWLKDHSRIFCVFFY